MPSVLVSDKLAAQGLAILRQAADRGELTFDNRAGLGPEQLREVIGDYDALIVRSATRVTAELLAAAKRLRVIGRAGIGVDNIDVPAATRKGVVVLNTPGGNTVTTAEQAISLMLSLARSIPQASASTKSGKWEKSRFMGTEVYNKTLGIVGIGNIGALVAERGQGLRMKVIAHDPFISEEKAKKLGVELVDLDPLCARADFISVHTPLTPETRHLINAAVLAKMKPSARLINCARGGIVDEQALADAIRGGRLAGAAVDVFEQEPPPKDHPLLQLDQVVCTPHLGAATDEAQVNVSIAIAEQIIDYLVHNVTHSAVNVPSVSAELLEVLGPYLRLGEKLGLLQGQLLEDAPKELTIEYAGEVAEVDVKPVTLAVLHGLLNRLMEAGAVNYVNAREVARERGIEVVEATTTQPRGYQNLLTVRVKTAKAESVVAGAVFGRDVIRLVQINDFYLEAVPEGYILMLHNRDVPGVVGTVGTLLGEAKINIAGLQLGRERTGGMAISLIHVDEPVSQPVLERIRTQPNIVSADLIEL
ncbi:MAG: phosphoglycerate dehydrogenase [Acidobacteria bacterium RBG_16_68_9]|nr:MAG: phosphoglycerate dehydrogenase [Acidobacteria bacterium RBG_16_68_9]